MIVETNEWRLLGIVAAHILVALLIACAVAMATGNDAEIVAFITASMGVMTGVLHATRLMRRELSKAHWAISEAVVIVHKSRGLRLSPDEFGSAIQSVVTERLAGSAFKLVTVRFGVPNEVSR